ncbi:carbohydrate-binding module family 13 protein [Phlebiopsis gigantea 11061_1 CR5-6]|uniref:Carbohydrate-binding module family 13 protein n=1 Tax=Phlebiopsis gigantea (strain 11061_1 CR5-6) TaxID=745531 RepID=A0A0C3SDW5_PHLG1|nr:carbohydrate-binding module family 13 protein [Phlebiopsis gigantea 11061_1 CR5-6]
MAIEAGVYYIQNIGTNTVVDLGDDSPEPDTKIQGYQKRELSDPWVSAQLWVIYPVQGSTDTYQIRNAGARLSFVDLTNGNHDNGSDSQKWIFTRNAADTAYVIRNLASGTYVDLLNGNAANGTRINGWSGSGHTTTNPHQLWALVRA